MAAEPVTLINTPALRLESFQPAYADLVVSWVRDEREAFWLAPATGAPITPDAVIAWGGPGREPLLMWQHGDPAPLAYGELNLLHNRRGQYWLGHLIVDPDRRGHGYGVRLTDLLLRRAFERYRAKFVTLVVFPENAAAIASYAAAGLRRDGYEVHKFAPYPDQVRLLRMIRRRRDR